MHQQCLSSECAEQDADTQQEDDEHPSKNAARESTSIHSDQLLTVLLPTDDIITPTEKVGCILVTSHLQQFLEDYPLSSDKLAFLDVYHMLSLLDKYLYDNPRQHTHCMFEYRFKYISDSLGCTLFSLILKMANINM